MIVRGVHEERKGGLIATLVGYRSVSIVHIDTIFIVIAALREEWWLSSPHLSCLLICERYALCESRKQRSRILCRITVESDHKTINPPSSAKKHKPLTVTTLFYEIFGAVDVLVSVDP